jgi:integrase
VREACEAWLDDARAGIARARGGDEYKPGTLRRYEQALRLRIYPRLGDAPFYRLRRAHVQDLADRLVAEGAAPATINTTVGALAAAYALAARRDEVDLSPTIGVKIPAAGNGRERFATPCEAAALLAAAPERDRAVWTAAMYSGLRRGELMTLRWRDIDFDAEEVLVARSWDPEHGPGDTKSRNRRRVPLLGRLRATLAAELLRQEPGNELCFGIGGGRPFRPDRLQERADEAWSAAGLDRLTLHDCRHTFASLMIAAGWNPKTLCDAMGHSSISITYDRYGHLMPGSAAEAAALADDYLDAESG